MPWIDINDDQAGGDDANVATGELPPPPFFDCREVAGCRCLPTFEGGMLPFDWENLEARACQHLRVDVAPPSIVKLGHVGLGDRVAGIGGVVCGSHQTHLSLSIRGARDGARAVGAEYD